MDKSDDIRRVALAYYEAGWFPLWLPNGKKEPPPTNPQRTGYEGTDLTPDEITANDWSGNLGIRMPEDVIGLDVDVYRQGNETLSDLLDRCGPLPPTWISHSSRNDGSGIRYFRVPVGMTWVSGRAGIDIIQRTHRYAAVWPSTHPEGRPYAWWDQREQAPTTDIPLVEDLPELPWPWIAELSRATPADAAVVRSTAADHFGMIAFLATHDTAEAPSYLSTIVGHFADHHSQGYSRHDTMQHCLIWAMEMARAKVLSAQKAVSDLEVSWQAAVSPNARRMELHSDRRVTEFEAMLRHAVGKVTAKTQAEIDKIHDDYAGITMNAPAPEPDSRVSTSHDEEASSWLTPLTTRDTGLRIVGDLGLMTDGRGLLHLSRFNLLHGDSGAGKSFMLAYVVAECIRANQRVAVFDLEDGPAVLGQRLKQLGIPWKRQDEWLLFFHPDEATNQATMTSLVDLLIDSKVRHAFVDSLGEAFGVDDVDEASDYQVTAWIAKVIRPLCNAGIGVTSLDHVTKAGDNLLYPSGSKRKRAAVTGTDWLMFTSQPFSLEDGGLVTLRCAKDRHGQYRRGDDVAELTMQPLDVMTGQSVMELRPLAPAVLTAWPDLLVIAVNICAAHPGKAIAPTAIIGEARQTGHKFKDQRMREAIATATLRGFLDDAKGYHGASAVTFVRSIPVVSTHPSVPDPSLPIRPDPSLPEKP